MISLLNGKSFSTVQDLLDALGNEAQTTLLTVSISNASGSDLINLYDEIKKKEIACLIKLDRNDPLFAEFNLPFLNLYYENRRLIFKEYMRNRPEWLPALDRQFEDILDLSNVSTAKINLARKTSVGIKLQQQQQEQQQQQQGQQQQQRAKRRQRLQKKEPVETYRGQINRPIQDELINEDTIARKYSAAQLNDPLSFWVQLVGGIPNSTVKLGRRITHVEKSAMDVIVNGEHKKEFAYGLVLSNLPDGFYLQQENQKLILRYDPRINTNNAEDRTYRIKLGDPHEIWGDAQQFSEKVGTTLAIDVAIKNLLDKNQSLNAKKQAFEHLLTTVLEENPDSEIPSKQIRKLLSKHFNHFDANNYSGLGKLLVADGPESVLMFLDTLYQYKQVGIYEDFKTLFLDKNDNYANLMEPANFENLLKLAKLDDNKYFWWKSLVTQHVNAGCRADFNELFSAFNSFTEEMDGLGVKFSNICPFNNITHMKVALNRARIIINKSDNVDDRIEQFKRLAGLDFGHFGAVYASRYEDFEFVTAQMQLTPTNQIPKVGKLELDYLQRGDFNYLKSFYVVSQLLNQLKDSLKFSADYDGSVENSDILNTRAKDYKFEDSIPLFYRQMAIAGNFELNEYGGMPAYV